MSNTLIKTRPYNLLNIVLIGGLVLVLLTSLFYYILYSQNNVLYLDAFSTVDNRIDIYSTYKDAPYTEQKKITLDIKQGRHTYKINTYQIPFDRFYLSPADKEDNLNTLPGLKIHSVLHEKFFYDDVVYSANQKSIFLPDTIKTNFIIKYVASLLEDKYSQQKIQEEDVIDLLDIVIIVILLLALTGINNKKFKISFIAVLILSYCFFYINTTVLSIIIESNQNTKLQAFWKVDKEINIYDENNSQSLNYSSGKQTINIPLINLNNIDLIRLDPGSKSSESKLYSITINEPGYKNSQTNKQDKFSLITYDDDYVKEDFISLKHQIEDPFFNFRPKVENNKNLIYVLKITGFVLLYLLVTHYFFPRKWGLFSRLFQVTSLLILLYILYLANFSWYNAHPDEQAHIASLDYFTEFTVPPKVGDPNSFLSYQYPWGVSRLDNLGVSYLFFGKIKVLLSAISNNSTFNSRAFNCLLFGFLALFCFKSKRFTYYCLPIFCIPQVWYLFSYANRGGFALFIAIFSGWQLINKKSYFNQYLHPQQKILNLFVLPMSILIAVLAIEQSNYLSFILFVMAILAYRFFLEKNRLLFFKKMLVFAGLVIFLAGVRYGYDVYINGFNKLEQQIAIAEKLAAPDFKPSVAHTDQSFKSLRLFEKGVELQGLFNQEWDWHNRTFESFAGFYGGEQGLFSAEWYYDTVKLLYFLIILLLLFDLIHSPGRDKAWLFIITLAFVFLAIVMAILFSWFYDFQAQGRYIFPLIPMLMVYFHSSAKYWSNSTKHYFHVTVVLLIMLSCFSFRSTAIPYLVDIQYFNHYPD